MEYSDLDRLLHSAIHRAVRGEPSPWPIHPKYPANGSFEDRFRGGDKQILLWAIDDCAQRRQRLPEWAVDALHDSLLRIATGEFSWDNAFGPLRAKGWQRRQILGLSLMYDILARVRQKVVDQRKKNQNINYDLVFEDVRDDLKKAGRRVGIGKVKKYYALARDDIIKYDRALAKAYGIERRNRP
jgi:hypothetical protein